MPETIRPPRLAWAAGAALLAAIVLLYWPGLEGGFVFDDYPNLVHDPDWKVAEGRLDEWRRAASSGASSSAGRPLAILSFAANHLLAGMDPFWLKASNLAMHGLNALLVWLLCLTLFSWLPQDRSARPGGYAALLVAAAWALHPLQASTVLYVVQRMEIGAATGTLLALLCYLRARRAMVARGRWQPWAAGTLAATAFGLGFKESALLVPGFMLVIEFALLRFRGPSGRVSRGLASAYGAAALAGFLGYLAIALPIVQNPAFYAGRDFSLVERLLTQLPVLAMYLKQSLLPLPHTLLFHYDNFPVSRGLASPPATLWAALLLGSLVALAASIRHRMSLTTLGIVWFFIAHALTSNVVPLELAFEHRNYLSLLGVLLALVQPLCALGSRHNADARAVMAALPVLGLAWLASAQVGSWGDAVRLAWTLENRNPTSIRASYGLGSALLAAAGNTPGTPPWSLAYGQFVNAAALPGNTVLPLQAVLVLDGQRAAPIPAERWHRFREQLTARALGPDATSALYAVSQCRIERRCNFNDEELLATFLAVLARNPRNPTAYTLYANFLWNVAGDRALAIELQREAVAIAPDRPETRIALARFLRASGEPALVAEGDALARDTRAPQP